jgi:hypothetical protein
MFRFMNHIHVGERPSKDCVMDLKGSFTGNDIISVLLLKKAEDRLGMEICRPIRPANFHTQVVSEVVGLSPYTSSRTRRTRPISVVSILARVLVAF